MLKFDSSLLTTSRILQPLWNRMPPEIKMIVKVAGTGMPRDDEIHIVSVSNQEHTLFLIQITHDRTLNRVLNGMACDITESPNMAYFIISDFGLLSIAETQN